MIVGNLSLRVTPGKDMGIAGQVTALLKHEYPDMIEESRSNKYFAKTWAHYDIIEDQYGRTAADRFREEFWVTISAKCHFFQLLNMIRLLLMLDLVSLNMKDEMTLFYNAEYLLSGR